MTGRFLYVKAGCSTCNRAREALRAWGVSFTERDLFRHPLEEGELRELASLVSLTALFSTRSPSARARGLLPEALSEAELLAEMLAEPRLIRRPLLRVGQRLVIGGAPAEMREALGG